MHYAKIMQIQFVIYGMTSITRILIRYNDYRGGDIHYKSQEKVLQCGINYIKLTHNLHSIVNQFNGHEARSIFSISISHFKQFIPIIYLSQKGSSNAWSVHKRMFLAPAQDSSYFKPTIVNSAMLYHKSYSR